MGFYLFKLSKDTAGSETNPLKTIPIFHTKIMLYILAIYYIFLNNLMFCYLCDF